MGDTKTLTSPQLQGDRRIGIAALLVLAIILAVYSNSWEASWHFDDYHNILDNPGIKIDTLSPDSLFQSLYASPLPTPSSEKRIRRPLAFLTFAINWQIGGQNVIGYHAFNIAIHVFTTLLLFLTMLQLFRTPGLRQHDQACRYFTALLAAVLWAINPIQTQAVTYIVQRMTAMATMFYVLTLFCYLRGRLELYIAKRFLWYACGAIAFVSSLGSKEIGAMAPLSILLVEFIFFYSQRPSTLSKSRTKLIVFIALSTVLFGSIGWDLLAGDPLGYLQRGYERYAFSMQERLMTQPRVLIFYLSQIFYPIPDRLSIDHDIAISQTWLQPWTTIPSIIGIMLLCGGAFFLRRKNPTVTFAILFFLLNHAIESSILPLEISFEHRNYLPSLFLFLPLALGAYLLMEHFRSKRQALYWIWNGFIVLMVVLLGVGTYVRNMAWATEKSLWEDAAAKAPGRARPLHNLAFNHYRRAGQLNQALRLYHQALSLNTPFKSYSRALILNNIGEARVLKGEYLQAIDAYRQGLEVYPQFERVRYNLIQMLLRLHHHQEAFDQAGLLLEQHPGHAVYLNLYGLTLLNLNRPRDALSYSRQVLRLNPFDYDAIMTTGVALSKAGEHTTAEWFLRRARTTAPQNPFILLHLAENSIRAENPTAAARYLKRLSKTASFTTLLASIANPAEQNWFRPLSSELLRPYLAREIELYTERLTLHSEHVSRGIP
jgi:tetratricopeptide (TPR) repeat protein